MITTQLAVVGGGPGGYAAAFLAADLGLQVTLIDPEDNPGGVCVYRGCIPSKALLHVAKVVAESRHAAAWGVEFGEPTIDLDKLRAFKNSVVGRLTGGTGQLVKHRKVRYLKGTAEIVDAHNLRVTLNDGVNEQVRFDHAILATGSRPVRVASLTLESALDNDRVWDSTTALDLPRVPNTLLVVGGGYIGLELGSVYATLGSQVTIVEMTPGLLPGADRDLVDVLAKRIGQTVKAVLLNTKVARMTAERNGIRVTLEGADVKEPEQVFDNVLVSVGRRPNSDIPGLDRTAVQVDARGFIVVDEQRRRTSRRSSRSATSSASRCWRTRRRTRGASPSRSSSARTWRSSRSRSPRSCSPIPSSPGAA